jgi:hypothetical protein
MEILTQEILLAAKANYDARKAIFFDSIEDINDYVSRLADLMRVALDVDSRRVALFHPSFYNDFLNIVQFRVPVHSSISLGPLSELRAEIVRRDLARYRIEADHAFGKTVGLSFRYGLLVKQLTFDPETRAIFGYLPERNDKNVDAYVFVLNGDFDKVFFQEVASTGAKIIILPPALSDIVKVLRGYNLDYLFFSNDASAKYSIASKLAFFKVASKMGVGVSTIMPIFSPFVDDVLAGDYFFDHCRHDEYRARILRGNHPGYSFRSINNTVIQLKQRRVPAAAREVIFFSGSNFWKINGDVVRLWAEILNKVPNSKIKLSLFPPHYATSNAREILDHISKIFSEYGVSRSRVSFLEASKTVDDWYSELLSADVYLDSFPYSSLTSIHDALQFGVPTVVMRGPFLRNCHAPAILHQVGVPSLAVDSREEYVATSVELARNIATRAAIRDSIVAGSHRLSNTSGFFSSFVHAVKT